MILLSTYVNKRTSCYSTLLRCKNTLYHSYLFSFNSGFSPTECNELDIVSDLNESRGKRGIVELRKS